MHPIYRIAGPIHSAAAPNRYSFSTLQSLELCPRQWQLLHSTFEGLPTPYPQPTSPQSVAGRIVHRALEEFSKSMRQESYLTSGCFSYGDFRQSFCLRRVVSQLRDNELLKLKDNPRVDVAAISASVAVDDCINDFKLLNAALTGESSGLVPEGASEAASAIRLQGIERPRSSERGTSDSTNQQATEFLPDNGRLSEIYIDLESPPLAGVIDLIIVSEAGDVLVDFKTGDVKSDDERQLRFYTTLWFSKTDRVCIEIKAVYASGKIVQAIPLDRTQLQAEIDALAAKTAAYTAELKKTEVAARPQADRCRQCAVRQLCNDYWAAPETEGNRWLWQRDHQTGSETYRDAEIEWDRAFLMANGLTAELNIKATRDVPERKMKASIKIPPRFYPGSLHNYGRVRLLSIAVECNADELELLLNRRSEIFWS